jgi:CheY-like chemotaxis protein
MNESVVSVLIVDDQPAFCRTAVEILEATDLFEVGDVAASGEEALQLLEDRQFDLVLLDVQMPGIGGLETARLVRTRYPETVVILTSVADGPDIRIKAAQSDAHYVSKADLGPDQLEECWRQIGGRGTSATVP